MDAKIDIFDEPAQLELKDVTGDITFKDVSFEYPDDHNQVFENLNLTIRPGEKGCHCRTVRRWKDDTL